MRYRLRTLLILMAVGPPTFAQSNAGAGCAAGTGGVAVGAVLIELAAIVASGLLIVALAFILLRVALRKSLPILGYWLHVRAKARTWFLAFGLLVVVAIFSGIAAIVSHNLKAY